MDENTDQPGTQAEEPVASENQGEAEGTDAASMNVLETYLQNFNEELSSGPPTAAGAVQQAGQL